MRPHRHSQRAEPSNVGSVRHLLRLVEIVAVYAIQAAPGSKQPTELNAQATAHMDAREWRARSKWHRAGMFVRMSR
jgi:hypothetical protein